MTELEAINGVGPGRAETLQEEGYDDAEAVASARPEDIGGILQTVDGGELVSNAQAVADASEIDPDETTTDDTSEEETESERAVDAADVDVRFDMELTDLQRNHVISALIDEEIEARRTSNNARLEEIVDAINTFIEDDAPYDLTLEQLNVLYRGLNNVESEYRSTRGLSDFVGSVLEVREAVQDLRSKHWP